MTIRPFPDTILGRIVLILVIGLAVSHSASLIFYSGHRDEAISLLAGEQVADRVVTVIELLTHTHKDQRTAVATLAQSQAFKVSIDRTSHLPAGLHTDGTDGVIREIITRRLKIYDPNRLRTTHRLLLGSEGLLSDSSPLWLNSILHQLFHQLSPVIVEVSVEFEPDLWVNVVGRVDQSASFLASPFALSMLVMIVAVLIISTILARQVVRSLNAAAAAADQLRGELIAPPIPETGPREVRRVARAFNAMQDRLRSFIEQRMQIVAAISHDLRTPITRIRLRAEMLSDPADRERLTADIQRLSKIVDSGLTFARSEIDPESVVLVDLAELIRTVCDEAEDAGAEIEFRGPGKLLYRCRPVAVTRAVTNLIDNAIKYGRRARVQLSTSAAQLSVIVDDDGPGIPTDELDRIFLPFYRVDRSRSGDSGGAGLGLAITRSIFRRHGGDVTAENRKGGGARLIAVLPVGGHHDHGPDRSDRN